MAAEGGSEAAEHVSMSGDLPMLSDRERSATWLLPPPQSNERALGGMTVCVLCLWSLASPRRRSISASSLARPPSFLDASLTRSISLPVHPSSNTSQLHNVPLPHRPYRADRRLSIQRRPGLVPGPHPPLDRDQLSRRPDGPRRQAHSQGCAPPSRSRAKKAARPFVLQNSLFTHALFSFSQASARRAPTATRGPRIRSCSVRPRRRTAAARRSKVGVFTRDERQCMCVWLEDHSLDAWRRRRHPLSRWWALEGDGDPAGRGLYSLVI